MAFIVFCKEAYNENGNKVTEEIENRGWDIPSTVHEDDVVVLTFEGVKNDRISSTINRDENNNETLVFKDIMTRDNMKINETATEVELVIPEETLNGIETFDEERKEEDLLPYCKVDATDYDYYGGETIAADDSKRCDTCSKFRRFENNYGVCINLESARCGLLTYSLQNGKCHVE